jgi:hypothetical protein
VRSRHVRRIQVERLLYRAIRNLELANKREASCAHSIVDLQNGAHPDESYSHFRSWSDQVEMKTLLKIFNGLYLRGTPKSAHTALRPAPLRITLNFASSSAYSLNVSFPSACPSSDRPTARSTGGNVKTY